MKNIKKLFNSYSEIDGQLSRLESSSLSTRYKTKWAIRRAHNDQAFYVLFFAQFEDYINSRCDKVIKRKKGLSKWGNRKLWDSVDIKSLSFMKRVSLLTEKGYSDYTAIKNYYDLRNNIAHGVVLSGTSPIIISSYVNDLLSFCRNFYK